jgi:steroid delta-isomerase-like uncharacterized protein
MNAKEAVLKELEALSRQEVEGVLSFYREDVVFEDVSLDEPLRGKQQMRQFMEDIYRAFPDLRVEVINVIAEGPLVAAEYYLLGTHRGPFSGYAPTGRSFRIKAVSVYEYDGSLFTRETFYWDSASLLRQLGLA